MTKQGLTLCEMVKAIRELPLNEAKKFYIRIKTENGQLNLHVEMEKNWEL